MNENERELSRVRERIDALDRELLAALSERAELARATVAIKDAAGGDGHYYRPDREAQVLARMLDDNPGPLSDAAVAHLFQEVMSACRALEKRMAIAFLGPEGTFTEAAALKHFGHAIDALPMESIQAVFRHVEADGCDYGVVPIENSTEGAVNHTLDMFVQSHLGICGEIELRIHHCLLGAKGIAAQQATAVYAHQQTFAQCRNWLDTHLPGAPRRVESSNAEAAHRTSSEPTTVAIAGAVAASIYSLELLVANIEDAPDNTTRFLVIGKRQVPASGNDKTSVMFSAKDRPGALFDLLGAFRKWDINMTRIESRPSRNRLWDYVFFVDFEGHRDDSSVRVALDDIGEQAAFSKVLGSYPRSDLRNAE